MDNGPPELNSLSDDELKAELIELTNKKRELMRRVSDLDTQIIERKEILYKRRVSRGYAERR